MFSLFKGKLLHNDILPIIIPQRFILDKPSAN